MAYVRHKWCINKECVGVLVVQTPSLHRSRVYLTEQSESGGYSRTVLFLHACVLRSSGTDARGKAPTADREGKKRTRAASGISGGLKFFSECRFQISHSRFSILDCNYLGLHNLEFILRIFI